MVKDLRRDPILEKRRSPFKVSEETRKDFSRKYREVINDIIVFRSWIAGPIGIALHLTFILLDRFFYPAQALFFMKLRIVDAILVAGLLCFGTWKKKYIVWCVDIILLILAGAICLMISMTDGASSHYYEGINLTILGFLVVNGFYFWHSLVSCFSVVMFYVLAAAFSQSGWDVTKFWFATYFVSSTAFFVVLMTKFYSSQHREAFMRNEELRENERKLAMLYGIAEERSKTDDLTKIYNRRYFFEILEEKIKLCKLSGHCFYLIIFDIDNFKPINDTYGHVFGDEVIATVAKTVRDMMRLNSYMGRYGGDEFMLLIDQATREEFLARVEKISQSIRQLELTCDGKKVELSASFGAARFDPDSGMDEKKLVELADDALLEVKRSQRGGIKLVE